MENEPTTAQPYLRVTDLRVGFDTRTARCVPSTGSPSPSSGGHTLGIVGESGSGKSVTSLAILGLHNPQRTTDHRRDPARRPAAGRPAPRSELRRLRGQEMAMIFQDPLSALHPYYTVGKQIAEAYRMHHRRRSQGARPGSARSRCSTGSASRSPASGSTSTRTSSPAACGSAR